MRLILHAVMHSRLQMIEHSQGMAFRILKDDLPLLTCHLHHVLLGSPLFRFLQRIDHMLRQYIERIILDAPVQQDDIRLVYLEPLTIDKPALGVDRLLPLIEGLGAFEIGRIEWTMRFERPLQRLVIRLGHAGGEPVGTVIVKWRLGDQGIFACGLDHHAIRDGVHVRDGILGAILGGSRLVVFALQVRAIFILGTGELHGFAPVRGINGELRPDSKRVLIPCPAATKRKAKQRVLVLRKNRCHRVGPRDQAHLLAIDIRLQHLTKDFLSFGRTKGREGRPGIAGLFGTVFLEIEVFDAVAKFLEEAGAGKRNFVIDSTVLIHGTDRFRGELSTKPFDVIHNDDIGDTHPSSLDGGSPARFRTTHDEQVGRLILGLGLGVQPANEQKPQKEYLSEAS